MSLRLCSGRWERSKSPLPREASPVGMYTLRRLPDRKLLVPHAVSLEVNGIRSSHGCSHLAEAF